MRSLRGTEEGEEQPFQRERRGRPKILHRAAADIAIVVAHHRIDARGDVGRVHRLLLRLQTLEALDDPSLRCAAVRCEAVGRGLEAQQSVLAAQAVAACVLVEVAHHAPQLVHRAAEALGVLLGELRRLRSARRHEPAREHADRSSDHGV